MGGNLTLAKRLAEFADALAEYDHLPTLQFALVSHQRLVRTQPVGGTAALAQWADAFGVPVLLDLSDIDSGFVNVDATVEIAGRQVLLHVVEGPSSYREFEFRLGIGQVEAGELVQVTATQLLAAVKDGAQP